MLIEYDTPYVVKTYYLLGYVLDKENPTPKSEVLCERTIKKSVVLVLPSLQNVQRFLQSVRCGQLNIHCTTH